MSILPCWRKIEARLEGIDPEMSLEEVKSDHIKLTELYEEQNRLKVRFDELYVIWEALLSEQNVQHFVRGGGCLKRQP